MKRRLHRLLVSYIRRVSKNRPDSNLVRINSIYVLTLLVTIATLTMFWVEFLLPEFHVGLTRSFVYYTLLTFYVTYKEIYRWLGAHEEKRIGAVWVLVWWTSVIAMEVISFSYHEQYVPLVEQYAVTVAVSVNFLVSWISKILYQKKHKRPTSK